MTGQADMDFGQRLTEIADRVTVALDQLIPPAQGPEADLMRAMRHAALANGKRMRPFYVIETGALFDAPRKTLLRTAASLECVHTYSLVHDDLPCMDDDDFRRGRPTNHKKYGEGIAVLTGDALLTIAFEMLLEADATRRYKHKDFVNELAQASGSKQLIAGQVADLEGENSKNLKVSDLKFIHERKTSALLRCSARLGGMAANATPSQLDALTTFGYKVGLAFQVIDDILDVTQTTEKLGKTAGKDENSGKSTYPALMGLEKSRKYAERLTREAFESLAIFKGKSEYLEGLAQFLLSRDH